MKFEYRLTLGYLIIGCLWIILSDKVLEIFFYNAETITRMQTYKGWFYVLITSIFLYFLLKHHLQKIRTAERKAKESDRLKTTFIQNISHEIRTPMNGIIGFTELLKQNELNESQKSEYLMLVSESSSQLLKIINEMLDISLIETGNKTVNLRKISLNDLCDEIYSLKGKFLFLSGKG